jgi:predicted nucleic acid binding AN1-type Zn finger protein
MYLIPLKYSEASSHIITKDEAFAKEMGSGEKNFEFSCTHCNGYFLQKQALMRHYEEMHM